MCLNRTYCAIPRIVYNTQNTDNENSTDAPEFGETPDSVVITPRLRMFDVPSQP